MTAIKMFPIGGVMAPAQGITDAETMWTAILQYANKKDGVRTCYRELACHLRKMDNTAIRELRRYFMQPFEMPEYSNHAIIHLQSRARKLEILAQVESCLDELDKMYAEHILMPMLREREAELSKNGEHHDSK